MTQPPSGTPRGPLPTPPRPGHGWGAPGPHRPPAGTTAGVSPVVWVLAVIALVVSAVWQVMDLVVQFGLFLPGDNGRLALIVVRILCLLTVAASVLLLILRRVPGAFLPLGAVVVLVLTVPVEMVMTGAPGEFLVYTFLGPGWTEGLPSAVLVGLIGSVLAVLPPSLRYLRAARPSWSAPRPDPVYPQQFAAPQHPPGVPQPPYPPQQHPQHPQQW